MTEGLYLNSCATACRGHRLCRREFNDPSIIQLYKRKGNPQAFDNHRHIYVVSTTGYILVKFF